MNQEYMMSHDGVNRSVELIKELQILSSVTTRLDMEEAMRSNIPINREELVDKAVKGILDRVKSFITVSRYDDRDDIEIITAKLDLPYVDTPVIEHLEKRLHQSECLIKTQTSEIEEFRRPKNVWYRLRYLFNIVK